MKLALVMLLVLGVVSATAGLGLWEWNQLGDTDMDTGGYVALVAGVVAALVVGVGLMGLIFFSSRKGYDDYVEIEPPAPRGGGHVPKTEFNGPADGRSNL